MNWYSHVIKNYCNFSGRASRQEYWMFVLFNIIFAFIAGFIDGIIDSQIFSTLYSLFVFIPSLSLTFRRLHDIDKSAWWILISLVPVVGGVVLFVFTVLPGTIGANRYGNDPKDASIS